MPEQANAIPAVRQAEMLRRKLIGPKCFLEHDGARWLIHGWSRQHEAEAGLVAALERTGELMRLPDGRLVLASPAARRRLIETTVRSEDGQCQTVTVNAAETPLGWMLHKKGRQGAPEFDTPLIAAAERLRLDYTMAQLEPRVTMPLDSFIASGARGRSGSGGPDTPLAALAAKQRFFAALDAVGPELSTILTEICCLVSGLEQAERRLNLPARSGKAILHLALTRLARHYGFMPLSRVGRG